MKKQEDNNTLHFSVPKETKDNYKALRLFKRMQLREELISYINEYIEREKDN